MAIGVVRDMINSSVARMVDFEAKVSLAKEKWGSTPIGTPEAPLFKDIFLQLGGQIFFYCI